MTTDTTAATGAAADTPAPELTANELGNAEPNANESAEPSQQPELSEHERTAKKLERRVGTVTRQKYEALARAQQVEQENQRLREELARHASQPKDGTATQEGERPRAEPRVDTEAEIHRRAAEIAAANEATRRANEILESGRKKFGETFVEAARTVMEEAGPLYRQNGLPTALGEAISEADGPAALLHYLGQNPDDAAELRGLSAAALGRRIAKLETQIAAEPKPQSAPTHKPVAGSGTPKSKSPSEMSDDEWYDKRRGRG